MRYYLILILALLPVSTLLSKTVEKNDAEVSQVMDSLFDHSWKYAKIVSEYEASMYVKMKMDLTKSNTLLRYLPNMRKLSRNKKTYIVESLTDIHYTAPHIIDTRVSYSSGTLPPFSSNTYSVKRLFSINVYSETLLPNQLISPLSQKGRGYYEYSLLCADSSSYIIDIRPKYKSVQMVTGRVSIDRNDYSIKKLELSGMVDFESFRIEIQMGSNGAEKFLPLDINGKVVYRCLRNRVEGDFLAHVKYNKVQVGPYVNRRVRKHHHDLTNSFSLSMKEASEKGNYHFFDTIRNWKLSEAELAIYKEDSISRIQTTMVEEEKKNSKFQSNLLKMGMFLVNYHSYHNTQQSDYFRFSPLLSIESLDYSGSDGLTYKTRLNYTHKTSNDRRFTLTPRIEYCFKLKELESSMALNYLYLPQLRGMIYSTISAGDRVSQKIHESEGKGDPDVYVRYNDTGVSLMHSIEPVNGLQVDVGFDFHYRYSPEGHNNSFAPRLILQWTPGLFYYMQGKEKVNLRSGMPTFRFDYERGIAGVFHSQSEYEREEFEVLHTFSYGLRRLMGRLGCGMFSSTKNMYFIDFRNFTHKTLGSGYYSSDIGGRYYLLGRNTYHSSRQYIHAQAIFETPFLLFRNKSKRISLIRRERVYLSVLQLLHKKPYVEYGYGISTHLFDFAMFSKVLDGKFCDFGFRVALELFRDRTRM